MVDLTKKKTLAEYETGALADGDTVVTYRPASAVGEKVFRGDIVAGTAASIADGTSTALKMYSDKALKDAVNTGAIPVGTNTEIETGTDTTAKLYAPDQLNSAINSLIETAVPNGTEAQIIAGTDTTERKFTPADINGAVKDIAVAQYAGRTAMKAATGLAAGDVVYLSEGGRSGPFEYLVGDYSAEVAADTLEGVYVKLDAVAATVGVLKRSYKTGVYLEWFGGGIGVDNSPVLVGAVSLLSYLSIQNAIATTQSERPAQVIFLNPVKYSFNSKVTISSIRGITFACYGARAIFDFDSIVDYGIIRSGDVYNDKFIGIAFQCSSVGAIKYDANNNSGSQVLFENCRLIEDSSKTGVAVDYTNQSSQLTFKHCCFHRIRTALDCKNADLITFDDCWLEPGIVTQYTSKDGYIRIDKGFCRVVNSEFSGGPSNAIGGATEVAFFNMGIDGGTAPVVDNAHLVLEKTRIGFETGSGALVNWFVPTPLATGTGFRCGVIIDNCEISPREDDQTVIDGGTAAPIIRAFTMPSVISIDDSINTQDRTVIVTAGSTTDGETLRSQIAGIDYIKPIDENISSRSSAYYSISGMTCPRVFAFSTSDIEENRKWMEIFGKNNYWYESNTDASAASVVIDTYFYMTATPDNDLESASFDVMSGGRSLSIAGASGQQVSPIRGVVTCVYDSSTGNITATWNSTAGYGSLSRTFVVTPVFYNESDTTEYPAITTAQATTSRLRLKISNDNATNIRVRGAYIKPSINDFEPNNVFNGSISQ